MYDHRLQDELLDEKEINLLDIISILLKRKKLIFAICSLVTLLTAGYSLTLPSIYSATARVLPPQKEGGTGLSAMLGQMGGLAGLVSGGGGSGANANELFISIIKSRSLGESMIKRLDLVKLYGNKSLNKTWETLSRSVKVDSGKDGIINITVEDMDPKRAALMANCFVEEFSNTLVRLNLSKAGKERLFLESRLDLTKKVLKSAEDDMKAFSERHNIVQLDIQAKSIIESAAKLKADIATKEMQLAVLRSSQTDDSHEVKVLKTGIQQLNSELVTLTGSRSDPGTVASLKNAPDVGLEYARKMRELKTQEALFEQLTKQFEMAKMSEAKDSSSIQVIDEARVPENRIRPKRTSMVLFASFLSLFASILLVFILNYFDNISNEDRLRLNEIKKRALSLK